MPDLIDRSEALRVVHLFDNTGISLDTVKLITDGCEDVIKEIPRVDAVHVVRCKDCKYANHDTEYLINENLYYCVWHEDTHNPNWYCADSERRY